MVRRIIAILFLATISHINAYRVDVRNDSDRAIKVLVTGSLGFNMTQIAPANGGTAWVQTGGLPPWYVKISDAQNDTSPIPVEFNYGDAEHYRDKGLTVSREDDYFVDGGKVVTINTKNGDRPPQNGKLKTSRFVVTSSVWGRSFGGSGYVYTLKSGQTS